MKERMPTFEEYLAAALFANAPGWITIATISYLVEISILPPILVEPLIMTAYVIGTIYASYLVTRIAYRDRVKLGLEVGMASIFINIILMMIFGGAPMTVLMEMSVAQIIGGMMGGYYAEKKHPESTA